MASNEPKATFSFRFDSEPEKLAASAKEVETFRAAMAKSDLVIKDAVNSLKRLQGKSAEVVAARKQLKSIIASEKDVMSKNSLALAKLGTTFEKATKIHDENARKIADRQKQVSEGFSPLTSKLGIFGDMLKGTASTEALVAAGMLGIAAAVAAVSAALVAGVAMFAKWALGAANAARSLGLMREAASGSAQNAANLGSQIDDLAAKVPTSKVALNEMANSMLKAGIGGGQLVDTLNAVAIASATLGNAAGAKLQSFVERSRISQRFQLNPMELQGTGLKFDDVAQALAKNLKVGLKDARAALASGAVKLTDGAKALRTAVESKLGGIALRQMLDLNVMGEKLKETLDSMTDGIHLEPLLEGIKDVLSVFDGSTQSGAALKDMVTVLGNSLAQTAKDGAPLVKNVLRGMIIAGLDITIAFYKVRNSLRDTFGNNKLIKNVDWLNLALMTGKVIMYSVAAAVAVVGVAIAALASPFFDLAIAIDDVPKRGAKLIAWFNEIDWKATGLAIVDGLVNGLNDGTSRLINGVKSLAQSAKDTFKKALGIASPSKVFADFGRNTTEGFAIGVDQSSGMADDAVAAMVDTPQLPAGSGKAAAAGGGTSITIAQGAIQITVHGGGKDLTSESLAQKLSDADFIAKLIRGLQDFGAAAGAPVPAGG